MPSSFLCPLTVLLFFGLESRSSPLHHPPSSFRVSIDRRRAQTNATTTPTVNNTSAFDLIFATRELNSVLLKYSNAADVLAAIGLNPDTHPEDGYTSFNPSTVPLLASADRHSPDFVHALADPDSDQHPSDIIPVDPVAQQAVVLPLKDYISGPLDVLYHGPINFGTPAQALSVDIDTGSADLWIPVNCFICENPQFSPERSSSYRPSSSRCTVAYGAGAVSGTLVQDVVAVNGASVPDQSFCAITKISDDLNAEPMSGMLGLAFGSIARSRKPTFFENLLAQKQVDLSLFSVHLTRKQVTGSQVCFGCYDTTKATGGIRWHPLLSRTYWAIEMQGLSVNDGFSLSANLTAAIDTGTSLIYLPKKLVADFYSLIPGAKDFGEGFYTVPCQTPTSVAINLGGHSYTVHPDDFNLGPVDESGDDCMGGILALGDGLPPNFAIIGDEFLKSWYSVFDYGHSGRVGFAPSINNNQAHLHERRHGAGDGVGVL